MECMNQHMENNNRSKWSFAWFITSAFMVCGVMALVTTTQVEGFGRGIVAILGVAMIAVAVGSIMDHHH
jgi:xanthine/uracil permease